MDIPMDLNIETIATKFVLTYIVRPAIELSYRTAVAHWHLNGQMPQVNRSYNKVRDELRQVGLLYSTEDEDDGGYLDQIELEVAWLPSLGEAGYVFESLPWIHSLVGYREGVIYLPADLPRDAFVPGGTLTDVVRHEFGHAWHWLEPEFFEGRWFRKAFGGEYDDDSMTPAELWSIKKENEQSFRTLKASCRNDRELMALMRRSFRNDFVSEYAATRFCEDFAETFMTYLRYRNCLGKFKSRTGLYAKLTAVDKAIAQARSELGT